jgi:HEPN domain-containing protein
MPTEYSAECRKALKAVFLEKAIKLKKTHDVLELKNILLEHGIAIDLSEDDCDFLNSIYLPSKYPLGGILPDYEPDEDTCQEAIKVAESTLISVQQFIGG